MYIPADCAIIKHYQGIAGNPETSPKKSIFMTREYQKIVNPLRMQHFKAIA
nr:MAG TPA: hypothetical protein [Caudoviricetes sp.]